jgi:hypothetical protein
VLDTRYYTETEVDTISGTLQTDIDGKSDTDHLHDDRYYTESEVDDLITTISGKLDDHNELNNLDYASSGHTGFQPAGDYLTDIEFTTCSGTLQSQIDGKSDTGHTHTESDITNLDKYTQSEVNTISGTLNTKISGKDNYQSWTFQVDGVDKDDITSGDKLNFVGGDNITITRSADDQITISGSEGVTNHSQLNELDYVSAGHTGFASTDDLTTVSGDLQTNIDDKSDVGHNHDDKYYTETELDNGQLDNRYYIESEIDTISGSLQTNIDGKSNIGHAHDDLYYTQVEVDTISGTLNTKIDGKDNYSSWSFAVDGVTKDAVTSGDVLDFVGGDNITVIRSADDQITISGIGAGAIVSDIAYDVTSWNGVIAIAPSKNAVYDEMETKPSKTTAAWSKSIGSGGDYATWAAMIAAMPDFIAHAVTITIKAGTTLTEICNLKNKHGSTNAAAITIQAEKYFPTSGDIPTADSATATTLVDGALATAAKGNDYFNSCWIFICTAGTHNISAVTVGGAGSGEFKVAGDETARYIASDTLIVKGSTNNDGEYTVSAGGSSEAGGTTTIPVDEAVAAVADGTIQSQGVLDNGFVAITDYVDVSGTVIVANWPAAQPIAGDRYLIVGALVDCQGTQDFGAYFSQCSVPITVYGIGVTDADRHGIWSESSNSAKVWYCGIDKCDEAGFRIDNGLLGYARYCGIVGNNTSNNSTYGGILMQYVTYGYVGYCGISDNNQRGVLVEKGSYGLISHNFGNLNGTWGTYARYSGQAQITGTECSGSNGNHSDPGTAGNANADQAAAY